MTAEEATAPAAAPTGAHADAGLLAVVVALLLPLAFSGETYHRFWAPKAAVALLALLPGLVALARLVAAGSRAAVLGALFLATAAASTLLSDKPAMALTGEVNWGTGLLYLALLVGAWALGRTMSETRRRHLVVALVAAATVNAAVAWLQARGLVPPLLESAGRGSGLMGNPVHLGALCAGALWLLGERVGQQRGSLWWLVPVALVAGAAQLSGGRAAVALSVVALVAGLRSAGARRGAAVLVAVALGVVLAPLGSEGAVVGSSRTVGSEAIAETGLRADLWRLGLEAARERPVLGWGPGRFRAATSPRYTASLAGGGTVAWSDAHNWVVEAAVTTGAAGLALLAAWLALAARGSRGALAGFALVVGAGMLVEPQTVGLTPLALLALGAAGASTWRGRVAGPGWQAASAVGVAVGLVAAGLLLAGEVLLLRASRDASSRDAERAARLLPPWPQVAEVGARVESFHALHAPAREERVLQLARRAVRRDPADPASWADLGFLELKWGTEEAAGEAFRRSLARNPWLALGLRGTAVVAERRGDQAALAESCRRLRVLGKAPPPCPGAGPAPAPPP